MPFAKAAEFASDLDPKLDLMDPDYPRDDPNYRESVSMWIFDDENRVQLPRFLLDDIPGDPEHRSLFLNIAFPDGRAVVQAGRGPRQGMFDAQGRPTIYGGGGLTFQVIEPWVRWKATYKGVMIDTLAEHLIHGRNDGRGVDVELAVEMTSAAPPWLPGTMGADAEKLMKEPTTESLFMGRGFRYEQLVRAEGLCRIGDRDFPISGRGLRIHRRSSRNVEGFWGHIWQSALFPSGRGFGYVGFPPPPAGGASYMEGYFFNGRKMLPARFRHVPWLTTAKPFGQDAGFELETEEGILRIHGETVATTFKSNFGEDHGSTWPDTLLLQQGCARYQLGGEEAFGMIERSNFKASLDPPVL
jgi:hypothetical protein